MKNGSEGRRLVKVDFVDFWHPNTREAKENNPLFKLLSTRFDSAPYLYENTVPGFLGDERILDRFEQIFSRTDLRPVATTLRNPVAQGKFALRRAIRRVRALLAGAR